MPFSTLPSVLAESSPTLSEAHSYLLPVMAILVIVALGTGYIIARLSGKARLARENTLLLAAENRLIEWEQKAEQLARDKEKLLEKHTELSTSLARAETELSSTRERLSERTQFLENAEKTLSQTFSDLSGKVLRGAQTQLLEVARQTFENQRETGKLELDQRKIAVEALVKPVGDSLEKLLLSMNALETTREGAYQALREQVASLIKNQVSLQTETSRLVQALRTPTGRGQWGELQLKRVVELAGMVEYCDFTTQTSYNTADGNRLRPDLTVKLPGERTIVIDSKTPMDAYLHAIESENEDDRRRHLQHHAEQVRKHVHQLSAKDYGTTTKGSPEFVVLFLPSESFFQAALEADPTLIEFGVNRNVIPATPTTLIALLRAVAYGWRQEALAENSRKIIQAGEELYDRCATLSSHFTTLGTNLKRSVESYNKTVASFESRIISGAKRLKELHVTGKKIEELAQPEELTAALRLPSIAEDNTSSATPPARPSLSAEE